MHNETDLESQDESVDSDTDNRTELECYGDVDTVFVFRAILTFNCKIIIILFPRAFVLYNNLLTL